MKSFFEWFKASTKVKRWIILILIGVVLTCYAFTKVLVTEEVTFEEVAKIVGLENVPQPELFVQLVTAIAKLAKQENVTITMVTYFRHVLEISGYALQIYPTKGAEHYAFTHHNGEMKAQSNGAFSRNQVMALSGYSAKLTLTEEQSLLKNLIQYFEEKTATKLKSIQGYELF